MRRTPFSIFQFSFSVCFACLLTSCDDFLDIVPMNDIVLENYWTEKADVTSNLWGCYESLEQENNVIRMATWGEVRSDNIKMGGAGNWEMEQVVKENMLPTNGFCKWASMYETINRCNVLIHYAPEVQAKDPNYTEAELKANIAEATTIRTLCYFYLMRAYRDVPYTKEASIDDSQRYQIAATPFDQLLDILIADMEAVKDNAVRRYYTDESYLAYQNSSRITRYAAYALLADLYLWKGNWDKCIECCEYILDYKKQQFEDMLSREGTIRDIEKVGAREWPLIKEKVDGSVLGGNVYNEIFGDGNSFESIFELYYAQNEGPKNTFVHNYYCDSNDRYSAAIFSTPTDFYGDLPATATDLFANTDARAYYSIHRVSESMHGIGKYAYSSVSYNMNGSLTETAMRITKEVRSQDYANWIIYRMTDIMLMEAEALVERNTDTDLEDAFNIVYAIYKRSNYAAPNDKLPKFSDYSTQDAMRVLVREERHRELLFEGKRWFDLVRLSRRDGNTDKLAEIVVVKQPGLTTKIKTKLADPNYIYFPYFRDELKVNPYIHQNPAFTTGGEEDVTKN